MIAMLSAFGPIMPEGSSAVSLTYLASERVVPGYGGGAAPPPPPFIVVSASLAISRVLCVCNCCLGRPRAVLLPCLAEGAASYVVALDVDDMLCQWLYSAQACRRPRLSSSPTPRSVDPRASTRLAAASHAWLPRIRMSADTLMTCWLRISHMTYVNTHIVDHLLPRSVSVASEVRVVFAWCGVHAGGTLVARLFAQHHLDLLKQETTSRLFIRDSACLAQQHMPTAATMRSAGTRELLLHLSAGLQ